MYFATSKIKYILFLLNTVISVFGILGIIYGVFILNKVSFIDVTHHFGYPAQVAMPVILISMSSIVIFVAFLGCCGAIRESVCMTMSYAVFLLILLIVQLKIVVFIFTNKKRFDNFMDDIVYKAWFDEFFSARKGIFGDIQEWLHCCGMRGPNDYENVDKFPPLSCCAQDDCNIPLNFYIGCSGKFVEFMSDTVETTIHVGLGLIVVEIIGFILACCLAKNVRNYKRLNKSSLKSEPSS